jgi:FKBP-type peptidyl-prolyl cis-trans isomerase
MKKRKEEMETRKGEEPKEIAAYLQKNNLNVAPDADSIFYLQTTKGAGPQVQEGDSVEIKYKGTFLDGNVFDPGNQPINMVYSKNMHLIQGWVKIIGKMNQGDKVRVLIPSEMGYGPRGMGPIQPYTPLIFDMEMVSVKPHK